MRSSSPTAANQFWRGHAFVASSLPWDAHETTGGRFFGGGDRDASNPHFVEHGAPDLTQPADGSSVAAFASNVEVPAGGEVTVVVTIGQTATLEQARALIGRYRQPLAAERALADTKAWWQKTPLGAARENDVAAFDRMVNDWLPYQVLTARLWGRTGSNQRSGGFGYRDQLQDVIPLVALAPDVARKQILLHASQQFLEGDVLQWWHTSAEGKTGLGARNHASDPHLWLVHVTDQYVRGSGDRTILDEVVPYLEGPTVRLAEGGKVFAARESREVGSVYDHCRLAVERALARRGPSGLPLIERGDWNDGLDLLGAKGRGESVWLGFFLYDVLKRFAAITRERGDSAGAERYAHEADTLRAALERNWRSDRYARLTTDAGGELRLRRRAHDVMADSLRSRGSRAGKTARRHGARRARAGPPRAAPSSAVHRGVTPLPWKDRRVSAGSARERRPVLARNVMDRRRARQAR